MPAFAYVANFQTREDLAFEQDEPSVREMTLTDFASPELASLSLNDGPDWVDHLKQMAERHMSDDEDGRDLEWSITQWLTDVQVDARPYRLVCGNYVGEAISAVVIVIQRVPLFQ